MYEKERIMQLAVLIMFVGMFLFLAWFFNHILSDILQDE